MCFFFTRYFIYIFFQPTAANVCWLKNGWNQPLISWLHKSSLILFFNMLIINTHIFSLPLFTVKVKLTKQNISSQLQRTWAQEREVVVEAEEIEKEVVERREASVRLKVTNLSGRERRVEVSTVNSENVVWFVSSCF